MTQNNRKHSRGTVVALTSRSVEDLTVVDRDILDLSAEGAFVTGKPPVSSDTITLHGSYRGRPFVIEGKVRWTGESATHERAGFGIEVTKIPSALASMIDD